MGFYEYAPAGVATVLGDWGGNTLPLSAGATCKQVYVRSTIETTVFDVIITNKFGYVIRKFTGATGLVNDLTPFPVKGKYTIEIENATRNEAFEVLLCFAT